MRVPRRRASSLAALRGHSGVDVLRKGEGTFVTWGGVIAFPLTGAQFLGTEVEPIPRG
jgi:hypothetical protein